MTFREYIIDFINYAFFLFIVSFFIVYFIAGDRFFNFVEFLKSLVPLGCFLSIFLIKFNFNNLIIRKTRRESGGDRIITYFSEKDKFIDLIIIACLSIFFLILDLWKDASLFSVIFKNSFFILIMSVWHRVIFRIRNDRFMYITFLEKEYDEIFIFVLSLAVLLMFFMVDGVGVAGYIKVFAMFIVVYFWHKILFKEK